MTDLYGNIPISEGKKTEGKKKPSSPASSKPRPEKRPAKKPAKKSAKRPGRSPQKAGKRPGRGKYLLLPSILAVLLAAYYGATALLLPIFLQKKFPAIFHEATGLHLAVSNAKFNPLTSVLLVNDVAIDTAMGETARQELLTIDRLAVNFNIIELSKGNIVTESLDIQGARLNVKRLNDKTYTFSSFLPPGYRGDAVEDGEFFNFQQLPFQYSLNNITIGNSSILLQDQVTKKKHEVKRLQLSLPTMANFQFDAGRYIQPSFSAVINGSPINLVSSTDPAAGEASSQSTKLAVNLTDIALPLYAEYLPVALPMTIEQGKADVQLEISFLQHPDKPFRLNIDYQAAIKQIGLASRDGSLTLKTPTLQLEGTLAPLENRVNIASLLLRDPVCTIQHSFTSATLDSLFPEKSSGTGSSRLFKFPALTAALVIADNGKVIFASDNASADTSRVLYPVQFSMRNFANQEALKNDAGLEKGSFRLSAESENDYATFSWQGHFAQTAPTGNVTINNMAAEHLVQLLAPDTATAAEGAADIRGRLALHRSKDAPLGYTFDKGSIQFSDLALTDGAATNKEAQAWLHSASTRMSAVALESTAATIDTLSLGNIFVEGATMHLRAGAPPALLQKLSNSSANRLEGIDFKGDIDIVRQHPDAPMLKLRDIHLQANELGQANGDSNTTLNIKGNNFAFTGTTGASGSITAKGRIGRAPLRGTIDIAFSSLPLSMVLPLPDSASYSLSSDSTVNGRGTYTLDSKTFKGAVDIGQTTLQDSANNRQYSFGKAVFAEFAMDLENGSYHGEKVIVKDIAVTEDNTGNRPFSSDGASLSSFSLEGMDLKLGDLSFARTALILPPGFPEDIASLLDDIALPVDIDRFEMFGTVDVLGNDQQPERFIEDFRCTLEPLQQKHPAGENVSLTGQLHDQGNISATGRLSLGPLQSKLQFTLDNVPASVFDILNPEWAPFYLDATLDGNVAYSSIKDIYSGTLRMQPGKILDSSSETLVGFAGAVLQDFSLSKKPFALHAAALEMQGPDTSFKATGDHFIGSAQNTIRQYLVEKAAEQGHGGTPEMDFDKVVIKKAAVHYRDMSLSPPWQVQLKEMDGMLRNFHLQPEGEKIEYAFRGALADGDFESNGIFDPTADRFVKHRSLRFEAIPLQVFTPLISTGFDISPTGATLDLAIGDDAESKNQSATIGITDLQAREPGSTTAFTIALLSDQQNRLTTVVPLKSADQPLHGQIDNHFQKLLVKCSVSPYLLLEKPFNDLHDTTQLLFAPGQSVLSAKSKSILGQFATLLHKHPHLKLLFRAVVQRSADARVVQQQLMEQEKQRVSKANRELLHQWQQQSLQNNGDAPDDAISVENIEEEELEAFTPATTQSIVVTDDMLNQLARERTERIHRFLVEQHSLPGDALGDLQSVSIIDTLDLPEIEIVLSHDQATSNGSDS
ncbi:MAG: DUF748 domain-containing protein [Desulfopila sp.]